MPHTHTHTHLIWAWWHCQSVWGNNWRNNFLFPALWAENFVILLYLQIIEQRSEEVYVSVCLAYVVAIRCWLLYLMFKKTRWCWRRVRRLFTHRAKTRRKPSSQLIIHLQTRYIQIRVYELLKNEEQNIEHPNVLRTTYNKQSAALNPTICSAIYSLLW